MTNLASATGMTGLFGAEKPAAAGNQDFHIWPPCLTGSVIVARQALPDLLIGRCEFQAATLGELADMGAVEFLPRRLMLWNVGRPGLPAHLPFSL